MKNHPLFSYSHADTLIHRTNPGIKLVIMLTLCIIFASSGPALLAAASSLLAFILILSGKRVLIGLPHYWKIYIFFAITGAVKAFTAGSPAEGILFSLRLVLMMLSGVVFYSTTRLTALRKTVAPLPEGYSAVKRAVDLMVMTLAFIPMIFRTADELAEARYSRCFKGAARPFRTIKLTALPLMIELFLKADEAADAWYSRGYSA